MNRSRSARLRAPLLVGLLTVLTLFVTVGSAQAAASNCLSFQRGAGCATTTQVWVNDRAVDGHSAVIQYRSSSSAPYLQLWDSNGAGNGRTVMKTTMKPQHFRQVRLCLGDSKPRRTFSCSYWRTL